jgi:beta-alanine--pyruvate transaminase
MTATQNFVIEAPTSLEELWMPFTANKAFKQSPRLLGASQGMYYTSVDGRSILDGAAGLWCVNAGHGREPIVRAIAETAANLDFAPGFQMGHPLSFALATEVAKLMPGDIDHVFFANSGSEAVDSALKIALAYWRARGNPERVRFVGRQRAYHGVGFGGISVGGIPFTREAFAAQLLPQVDHLPHTHGITENFFSRGQPLHGAHLADELEAIVAKRGAETIAAVIVEPVAGSTGVLVPPVGYLERLRAICDRHGILLIFDEVITGFGRTGAPLRPALRRDPGHDDYRQGPDEWRSPNGCRRRAARDLPNRGERDGFRDRVLPRLHVLRTSVGERRWTGDAEGLQG